MKRTDSSWNSRTTFIVSAYHEKDLPTGANLRFEGLRQANAHARLDIGFIPNEQASVPIEFRAFFAKSRMRRRVASLLLQIALRNHRAVFDAVPFLPFSNHYLLIHDSGNLFAGARRSGRWRSRLFRAQLKLVRNFVAVSQSTARVLRLTGYHAPTVVSPNAVGLQAARSEPHRDIDFLFVSSGAHHKRDAQAYRTLRQAFPAAHIVLAGHQLENQIGHLIDKRAVFVNSPSDAELAALFGRSRTYITWSRVEGYGMTVLEGLASGCTCLITNIPCFKELFRDFPQVAFLPTKGLESSHLQAAWQAISQTVGPKPSEVGWQEILLQLQEDISRPAPILQASSGSLN